MRLGAMSICLTQESHAKLHTVRALVVDEDAVYQNLLCKLLVSNGVKIVGRVSHLDEAVGMYKDAAPDVVLADLSSDVESRITRLFKIKEIDPLAKIVVFSILSFFGDVAQGRDGLIDAHIMKGSAARDIVGTIQNVVVGEKT